MMRSLQTMAWPVFLGCVSLWAGPALAKVVPFNVSECPGFYYRDIPPSGFDTSHLTYICQRFSEEFHYATLYDSTNRIPRWSAYRLDNSDCPGAPNEMYKWLVEPQLAEPEASPNMLLEDKLGVKLGGSQAINEDYENTAYERGHLNPFSFQCKNHRMATFTLTNAVPMEPHFHQIRWMKLEKSLKTQLSENCIRNGGSPYLVTGAVPGDNVKIPIRGENEEGDRIRQYHRVSVPSHIWTAMCCNHADYNQKFSLSILAENKKEPRLQIIPVEELNTELARLYSSLEPIQIFADGCGSKNPIAESVSIAIKLDVYDTFHIFLSDFYSQLLPAKESIPLDTKTAQVLRSKNLEEASMRLTRIEFMVSFPSLAEWHQGFEKLYEQDNLSCVLAPAAAGTTDRVCILRDQKHLPGTSVTAAGQSCVGAPCGFHGSAYSWCNTSYSGNWDYCCTDKCSVNTKSEQYECSRGDGSTVACSPQYSTVTITGKPCRADHPCRLYGKDYYWCYVDYKQNWEYCCSPQHYCGTHGKSRNWCYTKDAERCWERCTP